MRRNQVWWVGLAIALVGAVAAGLLLIVASRKRANGRLDLVWFRGWAWMAASTVLVGAGLATLANSNTARGLVALALAAFGAARGLSLLRR
jgi:steroid 5-alpha reductase family enzyme